MELVGIFGGTFDPVHFGHLRTALESYAALQLSEVRFVPAAQPPHRQAPVAPARARLEMVQLAVRDQQGFVVDDCEYHRDGPSYMVDTLRYLRQSLADDQVLCLLVGADSLMTLDKWHEWQQMFELCHVVAMSRPGYVISKEDMPVWMTSRFCDDVSMLASRRCGCICLQTVTEQAIAASDVRAAIARGDNVSAQVPAAVIQYIREHKLYL